MKNASEKSLLKIVVTLAIAGCIVFIVLKMLGSYLGNRFIVPPQILYDRNFSEFAPNPIGLCGAGVQLGNSSTAIAFKCETRPGGYRDITSVAIDCSEYKKLAVQNLKAYGNKRDGIQCSPGVIDALLSENAECFYGEGAVELVQVEGDKFIEGVLMINNPKTKDCLYVVDTL